MKQNIDRLMEEAGIDTFLARGSVEDTDICYLIGGAKMNFALILKKRGSEPVLIHRAMERGEAGAAGLRLVEFEKYDWRKMLDEEKDELKATARLYKEIFADFGVEGQVAFYGPRPTGTAYHIVSALCAATPGFKVAYEPKASVIDRARMTKDEAEIAKIRATRDGTVRALRSVLDFVTGHRVKDNKLVHADGAPLRIGDLKRSLRRSLFEENLVEGVESIVSIGRDAGLPHGYSKDGDEIELGKTLLFDVFPKSIDSWYYFDLTRTYCLGHAPDRVAELYEQVNHARQMAIEALKLHTSGKVYENLVCDYFERQNHPTLRTDRQAKKGYVHSLGHGVGLNVHEYPYFGLAETASELLPGSVFTVEPGLYYPDEGMGVRIEDVIHLDEQGKTQNLTDFPYELVLPVG